MEENVSTASLQAQHAEFAERVAAGAALLDQHQPGWERQIDVEGMDLASAEDDVLGQLHGSFDEGLDALLALDAAPDAIARSDAFAVAHGFDGAPDEDEPGAYREL